MMYICIYILNVESLAHYITRHSFRVAEFEPVADADFPLSGVVCHRRRRIRFFPDAGIRSDV